MLESRVSVKPVIAVDNARNFDILSKTGMTTMATTSVNVDMGVSPARRVATVDGGLHSGGL